MKHPHTTTRPRAHRTSAARRKQRRVSFLFALLLFSIYAAVSLAGRRTGNTLLGYAPDDPAAPRYIGSAPYVVAIDAGHGGAAVGAVGAVVEAEMTWQTAEALFALLEADPNFTPVRTRQDFGQNPSPADRAAAANRAGAQLFLSIHGNGAADPNVRGFECYPVPPERKRHSQSLAFGQMVSRRFAAAGHTLRGTEGIRYAYYQGDTKVFSEVGGFVYERLPTFGVVERTECPAILAEQCFVTSDADVAAFGSGAGIQTAAWCYYLAICDYFDCEPMAAA